MATVNLGRIKPVFRGAYNNSTAYVIDDIVTSGNETFIAIAATQGNTTSDGSKWTKLAAKGADGTDVAATLANKEISFKTNAGALDGIPIGNAGEFLKVNSGATGYEFATVTTAVLGISSFTTTSRQTYSGSSYQTFMSGNFTKSSASSKITIIATYSQYSESNGAGTSKFVLGTSSKYSGTSYGNTSGHQKMVTNQFYISDNTQTGSLAWTYQIKSLGGTIFLPNNSDDSRIDNARQAVVTIIEHT